MPHLFTRNPTVNNGWYVASLPLSMLPAFDKHSIHFHRHVSDVFERSIEKLCSYCRQIRSSSDLFPGSVQTACVTSSLRHTAALIAIQTWSLALSQSGPSVWALLGSIQSESKSMRCCWIPLKLLKQNLHKINSFVSEMSN